MYATPSHGGPGSRSPNSGPQAVDVSKCPRFPTALSEVELQAELHDARRQRSADLARGRGSYRRVRIVEIRAVEGVEHFPAEAQFRPLADLKVAVDPEIGVEVSRSDQNKICRVAKSELPRRREGVEVEPAVNSAPRGKIAVADTIR